MSNDNKFIDGLIFKAPHERAPEYVIAKVSIKRLALIEWLQKQTGDWVNADLKKSREGKLYAAVDDWKASEGRGSGQHRSPPTGTPPRDGFDDELPDF